MKPQKKIFDTIQFLGLFLGILLSVILIFPANQDPISSVILGLCVTITFQLFDLQQRQGNSEEVILDATKISQELYQNKFLHNNIRDVIADYYSVQNGWFPLFKRRATDAVLEYRNLMHSMAEGYIIVDINSPFTFGIRGIESSTKSIKAVAVENISIWLDSVGGKYMNAHVDAIKRGVSITRVFIQPKNIIHEFQDVFSKQRSMGIKVYVAYTEDLPRDLYEDYIIIDEKVAVSFALASDNEARDERISINEVEVERLNKKFDKLLLFSKSIDETFTLK